AGKTRLAVRGKSGQVLRRTDYEEIHRAQVSPLLPRYQPEHPVQALEHLCIIVDEVEEDRVQEEAGNLGGRRIAVNGRPIGLVVGGLVAGRNRENPPGAEVYGGRAAC